MKSRAVKTLAVLLCAFLLAGGACAGLGILLLRQEDLYNQTLQERIENQRYGIAHDQAWKAVTRFSLEHESNIKDRELGEYLFYRYQDSDSRPVGYVIRDQDGTVLDSRELQEDVFYAQTLTMPRTVYLAVREGTEEEYLIEDLIRGEKVEPLNPTETFLKAKEIFHENGHDCSMESWTDWDSQNWKIFQFRTEPVSVEISLPEAALTQEQDPAWLIAKKLYPVRYDLITLLVVCVLMVIPCMVYLGWASGRTEDGIAPASLYRMPLDAALVLSALLEAGLIFIALYLAKSFATGRWMSRQALILLGLVIWCGSMTAVLVYYLLTAQAKAGRGYWIKNCLISRIVMKIWGFIRKFLAIIPGLWRWTALLAVLTVLLFGTAVSRHDLMFLGALALWLLVMGYVTYSFGTIVRGLRQMCGGNLNAKVSTEGLVGSFRQTAEMMNSLADVAVVAAEKHMQAERMKTELITNVSHDIKTPLTSIINFADLLQKPHTQDQEQEYLAVLDRQSHRMKRLIEDLMELSKASTGNLTVNIQPMDGVEMLNQALGEFSDKLDALEIQVVSKHPQSPVMIRADGRLSWRVLSNLLTNITKYALPGTRLYVDMVQLPGKVLLSLKNISREQLSISGEELMERFVRGDQSRNTEGSGLGLNIARSLREVQHGQLQLLVDGDLFKVTLLFPADGA